MCTLIMLRRQGHSWPLIVGANRDEMRGRPWRKPGRHWADRPDIIAGLDEAACGSWLGLNRYGVLAAVLNRAGTLGPLDGKRSRGALVLEALDHADAAAAATALADLDPRAYRPFNLVVADNREAFWLAHRGDGDITVRPVPDGLSMLTSRELDDPSSPRIARYAARFREASPPDPAANDWRDWQDLLEDRTEDPERGPESAMSFMTESGFGTVCSSLLALPAAGRGVLPEWRFAVPQSAWEAIPIG
jgi:uncharacterized protein with NRDE domain